MKTIILLFLILVTTSSYSQQYSTYYSTKDIKADVNVNVSGEVYQYKTITTIDYGALQLANAQRERNRLEELKFTDDRQRRIAKEITEDVLKAYEYGTEQSSEQKRNEREERKKQEEITGFKNFTLSYVAPHTFLFSWIGGGKFQNISKDGITTELIIYSPTYKKIKMEGDMESLMDSMMAKITVGQETEEIDKYGKKHKIYFHKKELNRATVFGIKGYKLSAIWEDRFEYGITDAYKSLNQNIGNGYTMSAKVRYYGDKKEVTFEQLEGRRFYLNQLIQKIISTATVSNEKIDK